jgi:hypothetical protein
MMKNKTKMMNKTPENIAYHNYMRGAYGIRRRTVGYLTVQKRKANSKRWTTICKDKHNLGTDAGEDFLHAQVYTNTVSGTRGANFIAVSSNTVAPAASDTTLAGEITTNGLGRAQATPAHSAGTNTTTIEITFTASGAHSNVQKTAIFNASTSGTMPHVNTFTATTLASGDELRVTWTITSTF